MLQLQMVKVAEVTFPCTPAAFYITVFYFELLYFVHSVSLVITGLGPDFTRLESFGKVDAFAENLVGRP